MVPAGDIGSLAALCCRFGLPLCRGGGAAVCVSVKNEDEVVVRLVCVVSRHSWAEKRLYDMFLSSDGERGSPASV